MLFDIPISDLIATCALLIVLGDGAMIAYYGLEECHDNWILIGHDFPIVAPFFLALAYVIVGWGYVSYSSGPLHSAVYHASLIYIGLAGLALQMIDPGAIRVAAFVAIYILTFVLFVLGPLYFGWHLR